MHMICTHLTWNFSGCLKKIMYVNLMFTVNWLDEIFDAMKYEV